MYSAYVTPAEYADLGYNDIPADDLMRYLIKASRQIDALTFNRINHFGFESLSEFQKDIIQTVICEQATFLYENKDELSSTLSKYAINGVSMEWGNSPNLIYEAGVTIEKSLYSLLEQTGLCCRLAR